MSGFYPEDALAEIRRGFHMPEGMIYLDGNSLGPLHATVAQRLQRTIGDQWGESLIMGWNQHNWIQLPLTVGQQLAPILGAGANEVICCDSLSINLFKCLAAGLQINAPRHRIVTEAEHFPGDNYIAAGLANLLGPQRCSVDAVPFNDLETLDFSDVAVLSLAHVDFKHGSLRDLPEITRRAQAQGALVLWDVAHSAGVVDIALAANAVDMAVGCTYKFLNGGPGSPGFMYLAERHQHATNVLSGWMGHANRFAFEPDYQSAPGMERFTTGTQSVIALSAVSAALEVFADVTPAMLRARSSALTSYFIECLDRTPQTSGLTCLTPKDPEKRGSQISLQIDDGFPISQALIERGIIVDFREPNILRFGISPLYNDEPQLDRAVAALADILSTRVYLDPRFQQRGIVT